MAIGFALATLFYRHGNPNSPAATPSAHAYGEDAHEALDAAEILRERALPDHEEEPSTINRAPGSTEDSRAAMTGYMDEARAFARKRELERLHNAGFSDDRIAWLEQRAGELRAQKAEYWKERAQTGIATGPNDRIAYILDPDLDLRGEIGEDEYDRYRRALGRPLGVAIVDVTDGSVGQSSGLMPGDEVVRYDGNRVYNVSMLDGLAAGGQSSRQAIVEVRRQGQLIQLSLPMGALGSLGVRSESPSQAFNRARPPVLAGPAVKP